jgi:hypothetical protein
LADWSPLGTNVYRDNETLQLFFGISLLQNNEAGHSPLDPNIYRDSETLQVAKSITLTRKSMNFLKMRVTAPISSEI